MPAGFGFEGLFPDFWGKVLDLKVKKKILRNYYLV